MVKNGDKILICLSTGRHSLSLMHALHQYRFYVSSRGIHFELGVVIGHYKCDQDDNSLAAYLDALGITCFDEDPRKSLFIIICYFLRIVNAKDYIRFSG